MIRHRPTLTETVTELEQEIAQAAIDGNKWRQRVLNDTWLLIRQLRSCVPATEWRLPCQLCQATGRVHDNAICLTCQGTGRTVNPTKTHDHTNGEF